MTTRSLFALIPLIFSQFTTAPLQIVRAVDTSRRQVPEATASLTETDPLRCLAFSPYVANYDPDNGPHPPPSLIDELLDRVVQQAGFRCIR